MKFTKRENESSGGGTFLKLKDGEFANGVFRGEVYEFYSKWDNANRRSVITNADDPDAKSRFRLNFVTTDENGNLVAKIWEFPMPVYNDLADLADTCDLDQTKVRVKRSGVGKDTKYSINVLIKEPLSKAQLKSVSEVELLTLEHPKAAEAVVQNGNFDSEIPF